MLVAKTAVSSGRRCEQIGRRILQSTTSEAARKTLESCLKVGHATEETLCCFMRGQDWAMNSRVDTQYFYKVASVHQSQMTSAAQYHCTEHSSLLSFLRPVGFAFGAATAYAPTSIRMSIYGALQDSISDQYNDHIRSLLEHSSHDPNMEVKELFLKLRDSDRVPEGSTPPPDLSNLQRLEELSLSQSIGAVVKGTCRLTMDLLSKI